MLVNGGGHRSAEEALSDNREVHVHGTTRDLFVTHGSTGESDRISDRKTQRSKAATRVFSEALGDASKIHYRCKPRPAPGSTASFDLVRLRAAIVGELKGTSLGSSL